MGRPKKEASFDTEKEVVKKVKSEVMPKCIYCESESVRKIKDTEKGGLYSCVCGNRFQA
jgi:transcription elongation factor Elf1